MNKILKVLFFGDVIGKPGRRVLCHYLKTCSLDDHLVIANVENIAHGFGVQEQHLNELTLAGVHVFTGGNHTFDRKEIFDFMGNWNNVLRPENYPVGTPGQGHCVIEKFGIKIGILNLHGRVFMEPLRSPFIVADEVLESLSKECKIIFVDFHAEATAEKMAMGWYLNSRVSAVVGTHTHVQTADERILPGGTAYITDAGACGPKDGVIGMSLDGVFRRLIQQLPSKLEIASGPAAVCGVLIHIDITTGAAVDIERIKFIED